MHKGQVHSIQSMGALDGPGIRYVVFTQGCNLRCGCCHNPDTWEMGGIEYDATELAQKASGYKAYFGKRGGVTLSGGEPLLQPEFSREFFSEAKRLGMNTCLDTSGSILTSAALSVLDVTDRVLLDIKYPTDELYKKHVGCSINEPLAFLEELEKRGIATTLRNVVIPTLTDNEQTALFIKRLKDEHSCVDSVELLPFRKICTVKYEKLGIPFAFEHLPEPDAKTVKWLNEIIE